MNISKDDIYYDNQYYIKGDPPIEIKRKKRVVEGVEEWYWVDNQGNEYTIV